MLTCVQPQSLVIITRQILQLSPYFSDCLHSWRYKASCSRAYLVLVNLHVQQKCRDLSLEISVPHAQYLICRGSIGSMYWAGHQYVVVHLAIQVTVNCSSKMNLLGERRQRGGSTKSGGERNLATCQLMPPAESCFPKGIKRGRLRIWRGQSGMRSMQHTCWASVANFSPEMVQVRLFFRAFSSKCMYQGW